MRNDPAELMALALPRLLSAINVDNAMEMKDKSVIVPMASPSLTRRESLREIDERAEKFMGDRGGV